MHPKYHKHLKEGAQNSLKMDWFLAKRLVHQVKPEIRNNITIQTLLLNFQFNLECFFAH